MNSGNRNTLIVISVILMFVLLYFLTCNLEPDNNKQTGYDANELTFLNHHDSVKYIGIEQCFPCHAEKYKSFKQTGMGSSFAQAFPHLSKSFLSEPGIVYDTFNDLYYYPQWEDSSFYITEFRLFEGDTVHKRKEKVNYIIGSGHHTNSHFVVRNDYVYQAPLTFYTQKGIWDLPPGFEKGNNARFNRIIEPECMTCHNALPGFTNGSANHYTQIPHGIDCERCHGPGSLHVEKRLKGYTPKTGMADSTIVNPGRLSWSLQVDLCQRCHLQGNAVLKENKSFFDFRPGMPLDQVFEVFMPDYSHGEEFKMAAHAERFQMSECFIKTNKVNSNNPDTKIEFTCVSCHDPHVSVRQTKVNVFNDVCGQCHSGTKKTTCTASASALRHAENNCVSCHMPVSGSEDIPHVTIHDHYIRKPVSETVNKIKGELLGLKSINGKNTDTLTLIKAYLTYFEKFEQHPLYMKKAASLIGNSKSRETNALKIHYYYNLQKFDSAAFWAQKSVVEKETDPWICYMAGRSLQLVKNLEVSETWLKRAKDLAPQNLNFRTALADLYIEKKKFVQAEQEIQYVLFEDPKFERIHESLILLYIALKDLKEANKAALHCLKLNPDSIVALKTLIKISEQTNTNHPNLKYWKHRLTILGN